MLAGMFSFDGAGQGLVLDSFSAEQRMLIYANDSDAFTFFLLDGTWQGTDQPGLSGNGTPRLFVNEALLGNNGINITDSDLNPTLDVVFANSGSFDQSIEEVEAVTQRPGTGIVFSGLLDAERILLNQPVNGFQEADIFASELVEINGLEVSIGTLETPIGQIESQLGTSILDRLVVPGQLQIESGGTTTISVAQLGVTGHLDIAAEGEIVINSFNAFQDSGLDFDGDSQLSRLTFNSLADVMINLDSEGTSVSGPAVHDTILVGDNRADTLTLSLGHMRLFDQDQATLDVSLNAKLEAVGLITLADSVDNQVSVGRRFELNASSFNGLGRVLIRPEGDVRAGSILSSESDVFVFWEDDSTLLSRLGSEGKPVNVAGIVSAGNLFVYSKASLYVETDLSLTAAESVLTPFDAEKNIASGRLFATADRQIRLDGLAPNTFVRFTANGNVTLKASGDLKPFGANSGNLIDIESDGIIATAPNTQLHGHSLRASGHSVLLANLNAADNISISGRIDLIAEDSILAGTMGEMTSSLVNFDSPYVNMKFSGNLRIAGHATARRAVLEAGKISDDAAAIVDVESLLLKSETGIFLGDGGEEKNIIHVCGRAVFDAEDFVVVGESADVTINEWVVLGDARRSINVDSQLCKDYEFSDPLDLLGGWTTNASWAASANGLLPSAGNNFWGSSGSDLYSIDLQKEFDLRVEPGTYTLSIDVSAPRYAPANAPVSYDQFTTFGLTGISSQPDFVDAPTPEDATPIWTTWTLRYVVEPGAADIDNTLGFQASFTLDDYTIMMDNVVIYFDAPLS